MSKLTAEIARMDIGHLREHQANPHVGLSLREEKYLQALEIALPVLEQKESGCQKCGGTGMADSGGTGMADSGGTGMADSGGTQPWGEQILIECDCVIEQQKKGNDGWIEWRGGSQCPVTLDTSVEVKFRNGEVNGRQRGNDWAWQRTNDVPDDFDIIAYRVIENDGREG